MSLSRKQIEKLLGMVSDTEPDALDCDGCYEQLAEFAEAQLTTRELPDALKAVETHLRQCGCCQDEYNTLLEGLRMLQDEQERSGE